MSSAQGPMVIEARIVHKTSNALKMTFNDGPGDPFAVAMQGVNDSRGKKLGTLFGFKNGGTGNHQITYRDGTVLNVASRDGQPSLFTAADGTTVATIERGPTSSAVLADGTTALRFVAHPDEAKSLDLFRLDVLDGSDAPVGSIDVVRRSGGWSLGRAIDAAWNEYIWWDRAGRALPVPILGTRLVLDRPVSSTEQTILVGACTDIAIGLRPYIAEMN